MDKNMEYYILYSSFTICYYDSNGEKLLFIHRKTTNHVHDYSIQELYIFDEYLDVLDNNTCYDWTINISI